MDRWQAQIYYLVSKGEKKGWEERHHIIEGETLEQINAEFVQWQTQKVGINPECNLFFNGDLVPTGETETFFKLADIDNLWPLVVTITTINDEDARGEFSDSATFIEMDIQQVNKDLFEYQKRNRVIDILNISIVSIKDLDTYYKFRANVEYFDLIVIN